MSIKGTLGLGWAMLRSAQIRRKMKIALKSQRQTFLNLIDKASNTAFGKDHNFSSIDSYQDFQERVPVRNYEAAKPYFERIVKGEADVSWPGTPIYLAKTSGTTSGSKYIPITRESIRMQVAGARDALMMYLAETKKTRFLDGKMIFLSGSPEILPNEFGIKVGRLSGIVNHYVPNYLQRNKVPSYETNIIEDWEEKVAAIVEETKGEDMRLISGIPPWVQMYYEDLFQKTGKEPLDIWPNLQLFVQGGVDFQPYRGIFENYHQGKVDVLEVFPASEGFFAFQNTLKDDGLMLITDGGIFYEFIPVEEYGKENPTRLTLKDVELEKQYALIISSNAGLWAYDIGDTIKFTSIDPWKIRVTGRVKHFISAFGEHVIVEEVNKAMIEATAQTGAKVQEFTVAPFIKETKGESMHEWLVEFQQEPESLERFEEVLDQAMRKQNVYYDDLRTGNILRRAAVRPLKLNASREYMKAMGKLGGQNKFPRLTNDRDMAEKLYPFVKQV